MQTEAHKQNVKCIFSLFALALLCYFDKILLGPYAVVDFYDAVEVHFSHFQLMARLWTDFGVFSWYPFHAGGVPSFVGQHPPYHPAVFLSALLPIWLLALLWNIGQMFLTGYGVFRFVLLLPRATRPTALVCAAMSSLALISGNVHIVMSFAFPAVFVWTVDLFRSDSSRLLRFRNALLILAVSLFSFPVLTLPHFPIVHLALVLFLGRRLPDFRRQVAGVFLVWTGYVLLYVPSIVSLFLYIPYAQRDWGFVYPGFVPALVSLGKWFAGRLSDQPLLLGVTLSLPLARRPAIRTGLLLFAFLYVVSGVFTSDFKALFAESFLLKMDLFLMSSASGTVSVLLVALAMDEYAHHGARLTWKSLLPALLLLPFLGAANKVITHLMVLGIVLSAIFLMRWGAEKPPLKRAWLMAALIVCLCGLGMMARQQFMTAGVFVPYAKGFEGHAALDDLARAGADKPFRVACVDVHPAIVQSHGLDTVGAKSPLFNKHFKEYVREVVRPQFSTPKDEAEFTNLWRQLYLTRTTADHDQRGFILNPREPRTAEELNWDLLRAMNVTHVVAARPIEGMEGQAEPPVCSPGLAQERQWLARIGLDRLHDMPLWIYALKQPMGRAYLAQPVVLETREAVLDGLGRASAEQVRRQVYLVREDVADKGLAAPDQALRALGAVRITHWSPDRIALAGTVSSPGVLVVSNNFDPHWQATVNGREQPVFRANHAFQGVALESAGPFTAELTFSTPFVWWLHLASGLGVLLLFAALVFRVKLPIAAEAGIAPLYEYAPAGEAPSWRLTLLAGAGMCAVWILAFVLFVLPKAKGAQAESMPYALATIPVIGLFIAAWTRRLIRRF